MGTCGAETTSKIQRHELARHQGSIPAHCGCSVGICGDNMNPPQPVGHHW